ncbi:uncharacterized protein LOC116458394 isoform X2 [Hylobates moloch]|uniref:uncharacterized protein LOC116458394 isoform X2 n=1 Tax=Hylobates moloch TaxID=81572 RepID=UPI0026759079|nr:uncharacterized protein LOC116458394 isoform X2 [Hylobates moloch]
MASSNTNRIGTSFHDGRLYSEDHKIKFFVENRGNAPRGAGQKMQRRYFPGPIPYRARNSDPGRVPAANRSPRTHSKLKSHCMNETRCLLVPWLSPKVTCIDRTAFLAVSAAPRRACASSYRPPFYRCSSSLILRSAAASESRQLLPGSKASNPNPSAARARQFREKASPMPRPLRPGARRIEARPTPLLGTENGRLLSLWSPSRLFGASSRVTPETPQTTESESVRVVQPSSSGVY